jgi:hypothetical protein
VLFRIKKEVMLQRVRKQKYVLMRVRKEPAAGSKNIEDCAARVREECADEIKEAQKCAVKNKNLKDVVPLRERK